MAKKKAAKSSDDDKLGPDSDLDNNNKRGFEDLLDEVEQVVSELESGELTLDDSLKRYEHGVRSLRQCLQHLQKAERRIELLVGFDEEGRLLSQSFDEGAVSLEEKQSNRGQRRGLSGSPGSNPAQASHSDSETDSIPAGEPRRNPKKSHHLGVEPSVDDSTGLF